jgi:hypothetical protein
MLLQNSFTKSWSRTGSYITAVTSDSAILQLPDSMEVKIPVDADHSQIVKFDNRNADTYQTVLGYLKQFEKNAEKTISGRFCTQFQNRKTRIEIIAWFPTISLGLDYSILFLFMFYLRRRASEVFAPLFSNLLQGLQCADTLNGTLGAACCRSNIARVCPGNLLDCRHQLRSGI